MPGRARTGLSDIFHALSADVDRSEAFFQDRSHYTGDIELRLAGNPENLNVAVRRTLAGIDPSLPVIEVMTMSEQVRRNFNQDWLIARLTELFGGWRRSWPA
jgi:macrolide transport system ATP-binding/permease protein